MTKKMKMLPVLFVTLLLSTLSAQPAHAAFIWTQQLNSGIHQWASIASSADGSKLAATTNVGYIYTSTDSGATWTQQLTSGSRNWYAIASSMDGSKLVAGEYNGFIYTSTDSGATWTQQLNSGIGRWYSIASSADGSKLAAVDGTPGYIYTSTDSGATWTQQLNSGIHQWYSIASSTDGSKLAAGENNGFIYTSTDSGATWTPQITAGSHQWYAIASSSQGTKLAAVDATPGLIYTSTDSGATWTPQLNSGSRLWFGIASSWDGTKLAACVNPGFIYTSTDSGATWTEQTTAGPRAWAYLASTMDGSKLAAADSGPPGNPGNVWTGVDATLSIDLASFDAVPTASGITLKWATGTEIDNAGFHLWRADETGGDYSRITASIIPAEGNSFTGASYAYEDSDVVKGQTYYYKLQDVDRSGSSTFHGPVSVTAGGLSLVSPQDGLSVSSSTAFEWEGVAIKRAHVEFSRSAAFGSKILRFSIANGQVSFTPTKAQWKRITAFAGTGNTVAWRVTGLDASGNTAVSATRSMTMD